MDGFDFHRRRLEARMRLVGSDPVASRSLLKRWSAAAGARVPPEAEGLRLPPVPLADLAGFDVQVKVEHEGAPARHGQGPDACVIVIGPSAAALEHSLRLLERRARDCTSRSAPVLWVAEKGWSPALAAAASELGAGDDILPHEVLSREGARRCLEVAVACLIDRALLRIRPAGSGEKHPEAAAIRDRILAWSRGLSRVPDSPPAPGVFAGLDSSKRGGRAAAGSAAPDTPWRRRALELSRIEPLRAADAAREIAALDCILNFTPQLLVGAAEEGSEPQLAPTPHAGWRRR